MVGDTTAFAVDVGRECSIAVFTKIRKKGTGKYFQALQGTRIELLTYPAIWRERCTLTMLRSCRLMGCAGQQKGEASFLCLARSIATGRSPSEQYGFL